MPDDAAPADLRVRRQHRNLGPDSARDHRVTAVGAAAVVVVGMLASIGAVQPLVYADEAGYLLNARSLAGLGDVSSTQYFSGYSYLLAPLYLVARGYPSLARLTQLVNLSLAVCSFLALVRLLRLMRPAMAHRDVVAVCVVTMWYPAYVVMVGLAQSENLLVPAFLGVTVLVARAVERPTTTRLLLAGAGAGLAVAIHPRATVVPFALAVVVVHGVVTHRLAVTEALRVAAGTVVGGVLAFGALAFTSSLPWSRSDGSSKQVDRFGALGSWGAVRDVAETLAGQTFYAVCATLGLVAIGLAVLGRSGLVLGRDETATAPGAPSWVGRFVVVAVAASAVLSAMFMAGGTGDKVIYGRYNEAFLAFPLALGIATLARARSWRPWGLVAVGSIAVAALLAGLLVVPEHLDGRFNRSNVVAVLPVVELFGGIGICSIAVVALALSTMAVVAALYGGSRWMLGGLAVVLLASSAWSARQYVAADSADRGQESLLVPIISDTLEAAGVEDACVTLDRRDASQWHQYNYRVLLPWVAFDRVMLDRDTPLCGDFVLSSVDDVPELVVDARLVAADNHSGFALWVRPGALSDELERSDRIYPRDWDGRVSDSAMRADIEVQRLPCVTGEGLAGPIELEVAHRGSGSPWPNDNSQTPGRIGVVRVQLLRPGREQPLATGRLPDTMFPGERTDVRIAPDDVIVSDEVNAGGAFDLVVGQLGGGPTSGSERIDLEPCR